MSKSALKQIRAIVNEHDVRDPRGALLAIEKVFDQPKVKGPKRLLRLDIVEGPQPGTLVSVITVRDEVRDDAKRFTNIVGIAGGAVAQYAEEKNIDLDAHNFQGAEINV